MNSLEQIKNRISEIRENIETLDIDNVTHDEVKDMYDEIHSLTVQSFKFMPESEEKHYSVWLNEELGVRRSQAKFYFDEYQKLTID